MQKYAECLQAHVNTISAATRDCQLLSCSVKKRKGIDQLRTIRRCIHGQRWGGQSLIAHPSVLKPLLKFFHLPQKVSEVTHSSLCAFGIARKGLILA